MIRQLKRFAVGFGCIMGALFVFCILIGMFRALEQLIILTKAYPGVVGPIIIVAVAWAMGTAILRGTS